MATETTYRIASWDTPLRVNPNRGPGRFNDPGAAATQYLSLHPLGPWAEYMRGNDLRDPELLAQARLRIWVLRVDLSDVVEIGFSNAAEFALGPAELIADDHAACRRLAERLRADSAAPDTLVVPSAALPGTRNVVILAPRVQIPYSWEPLDPVDVPSCAIAERSHPPEGLEAIVRFRGEPHAEFEAWSSGRGYAFPDLG